MIPFSPGPALRAAGPAVAAVLPAGMPGRWPARLAVVLLGVAVYAGDLKGRAIAEQARAAADQARAQLDETPEEEPAP
jgi:hypothetical protein